MISENILDEEQQVHDVSRTHFTITPNVIWEYGLTTNEFMLYSFLKMICGEGQGSCWMTLNTMESKLPMSRKPIINARKGLEEKGLIKTEKTPHTDGSKRCITTILDLWQTNSEFFIKGSTQCQNDTRPSVETTLGRCRNDTGTLYNKNPLTKTQTNKRVCDREYDKPGYNGFFDKDKKKSKAREISEKLWNCLRSKNLLKREDLKPQEFAEKWANDFKQFFIERDDAEMPITFEEIEELVDWYIENIDYRFRKRIYSAKSFCDSYGQIIDSRRAWRLDHDMEEEEPQEEIKVRIVESNEEREDF